MNCPSCDSATRVLESRRAEDGAAVRRRRECLGCGSRYTTFERFERPRLYIRKRDGARQPFERTKLRAALLRAAHKRPVSAADVEALVERIELAISSSGGELTAERVGELCLQGLRDLDWGAYLQFAGTLPDRIPALSGGPEIAGSVRPDRDPAQFPRNPASRRRLDE
jgi:transcriptional repressor NrdR